jgi:hypothetical protein
VKSGRIAVTGLAVVASIVAAVAITAVVTRESSRRFPDNFTGTLWLRKMSDIKYEIPRVDTPESIGDGNMRLTIDTGSDDNRHLMLWTSNGTGRATNFDFSSDRLTMQDFVMNMHPVHVEHWDALTKANRVLSSNPTYRFDGRRLKLNDDQTSIVFALGSS